MKSHGSSRAEALVCLRYKIGDSQVAQEIAPVLQGHYPWAGADRTLG